MFSATFSVPSSTQCEFSFTTTSTVDEFSQGGYVFMPYQCEWYIPYRVIDARFVGRMTLEDEEQFTAACANMLTETQNHAPGKLAYLILDTLDVEFLPPHYLTISRALPVLRFKNRGPMFLIVKKSTIRSIIELTAHVMHFQLLVFSTRQDALTALEAVMLKDDLGSSV